jgi:hypothetical protein
MSATRDPLRHRSGHDGSPIRVLALTIIAVGLLATGCFQTHDPRNDSSRVDKQVSTTLLNVQR